MTGADEHRIILCEHSRTLKPDSTTKSMVQNARSRTLMNAQCYGSNFLRKRQTLSRGFCNRAGLNSVEAGSSRPARPQPADRNISCSPDPTLTAASNAACPIAHRVWYHEGRREHGAAYGSDRGILCSPQRSLAHHHKRAAERTLQQEPASDPIEFPPGPALAR